MMPKASQVYKKTMVRERFDSEGVAGDYLTSGIKTCNPCLVGRQACGNDKQKSLLYNLPGDHFAITNHIEQVNSLRKI
jgi:hypothetical protein